MQLQRNTNWLQLTRSLTSSQALDSSNIQAVATRHQQRCQAAWGSFPRKWVLWARQNLSPDEWAALQRMGSIWGELGGGLQLQEALDSAHGAAVPTAGALGQDVSGDMHLLQEAGHPPLTPTHGSAAAEGCAEPLIEPEDCQMAELDEERDVEQVSRLPKISAMARSHACHNLPGDVPVERAMDELPFGVALQASGVRTPLTLSKAQGAAQRLQWLVSRVARSRLADGLSRESVEKFTLHFWSVEGQQRCETAMEAVMAVEGQRASTDHTYHVVSNLAAKGEDGRFVALKASLTSAMGQNYVLGCKASYTASQSLVHVLLLPMHSSTSNAMAGFLDTCNSAMKSTTIKLRMRWWMLCQA